jgi:hypothetical protein
MKEKKSVKYLGVIMDCNLNWKDHVFELCKKYPKVLTLFKLRDSVSIDKLFKVYYSVIYPFFMYAVLVWDISAKEGCEDNDISGFPEHTSPLFKGIWQ